MFPSTQVETVCYLCTLDITHLTCVPRPEVATNRDGRTACDLMVCDCTEHQRPVRHRVCGVVDTNPDIDCFACWDIAGNKGEDW